jgi:cytochrome c peroxidase
MVFVSGILAALFLSVFLSCKQRTSSTDYSPQHLLLNEVDSFSSRLERLQSSLQNPSTNQTTVQTAFLQARLAYKKFEWATEYFMPSFARMINGPPQPEVEMPGPKISDPSGLQLIESYLFPVTDSPRIRKLLRALDELRSNTLLLRSYFISAGWQDWQLFDAVKLEVFRIETLGITGFDGPLTQNSMPESEAAFTGLQMVLRPFEIKAATETLSRKLDSARNYLCVNAGFNSFNRMEFITVYCNPITNGISRLQNQLQIRDIKYNRLLNQDAGTIFDSNAFNVNAYAPDRSSFISHDKVVLGEMLFADPALSGSGKRSCRSCHQPDKMFTDGMQKNTVIGQQELLERNTPTLINAALQPSLFYDLRANSLEEQSVTVIQSSREMHGSLLISVKHLWKDSVYRNMFLRAFPFENKSGIDSFEVMNAIGSYVRSLVSLNSRFDEYMRGNSSSMNMDEINGFNLFMGKAKCGTCHYMPLFNGNFPPAYKKIESEVIGVPKTAGGHSIDPDPGRYQIIKIESFRHAFKTSSLRNVNRTAPYMHNGVFSTLEQVLDFYNRGGGAGLGIKIPNQSLPVDSLRLSEKEQADIVAFMKSLENR